jgi:hypothetical protein
MDSVREIMAVLTTKPFQIYLREGQIESLRALAKRRDQPIAELVRQGVDLLLATIPVEEDPLLDIVGMFDSGMGDLALDHDRYLAESEMEDNQRWVAKSSSTPVLGLP